jgi:two-component system phosphate regulon response regulator PhoB
MAKTRILIVEDDRSLGDILAYNLQREGFEIHRAVDGRDGLTQAQLKLPDIVLLDVMLPGLDGIEVCRQLRSNAETKELLVMMLTAEADQLLGFHVGADDYVTKPFSVRVLIERIKALKRRTEELPDASGDVVARLGISVDRRRFKAMAGNEQLELTKSEFRLLDTLIRQPGRAFDRAELIDAALGGDTLVLVRTIDVHIRALRRKLGAHADAIETVRGVGYRFREA